MKKLFILLVFFSLVKTAWAQPSATGVISPRYVQAVGSGVVANDRRTPYVCRLTIEGLNPGATYRYYNRFTGATDDISSIGEGVFILIKESGFVRVPSPNLSTAGRYGELTTDASGKYTGWFACETGSSSQKMKPGMELQMVIVLNNGAGHFLVAHRVRPPSNVKVLNYGTEITEDANQCTGIWSKADGGTAKNFVMLYDNEAGTGRPIAGTFIESDGTDNSLANNAAEFYASNVNGVDKAWGTIIPNHLTTGIRKIVQYDMTSAEVGSSTSTDGMWLAQDGIGTVSTVNPTGGSTALAIDGYAAALYPPRVQQSVSITSTVPSSMAIGDAGFTIAASATSGLTNFQFITSPPGILSISGNTVTATGVGTATVIARQVGNATYQPATATSSVITVKKKQNISFTDIAPKTYGDDVFTLDASSDNATIPITVSSSDPAIAEVFYEPLESRWKVLIHGAGDVQLTAAQTSDAEYQEASVIKSLSVQKKALTITADNKSKVVNSPNPVLTATYQGFIAGENETDLTTPPVLSTAADDNSPVGDYAITVSGAVSPNYDITFVNGTLAVVNKLQSITFPAIANKTYGAATFDPGAVANTGVVPVYSSSNTAVAVIDNNQVVITGTGQVRITATFAAIADYPLTTAERTFTVLKKPLTVTAEDKTRAYGKDNPQLTVQYTGFVYDETSDILVTKPVLTTEAERSSPVSTYTITISGATAVNYDITYVYGTLTISRAPLTIAAENKSKAQGEPNPPLTVNYDGFVNGDTHAVLTALPSLYTSAETTSSVGDYAITVSGAAAGNYAIQYVDGTLSIKQKSRTLTYNALVARSYGDADFDAGAVLSSGEMPEYKSSNTNVATIVNGKVHIVSAGVTTVTATAPANSNYENTPTKTQNLVINRAAQFIRFDAIPQLQEGSLYNLDVSATSGMEVTLTIENTGIVSLEGGQLVPHRAGITRIIATQAGNANYLPADAFVREVEVADAEGNLIAVRQALSINGDGVNESLVIDGIEDYPDNHVTIVNRNGVKVFETHNYDNVSNAFQGKGNDRYFGYLPQGTYFYVLEFKTGNGKKNKTGFFVLKY